MNRPLIFFLAIFLKNNWTHVLVQDRKETVLRPYNHIYMDFRNGLVALFNEKIFFLAAIQIGHDYSKGVLRVLCIFFFYSIFFLVLNFSVYIFVLNT